MHRVADSTPANPPPGNPPPANSLPAPPPPSATRSPTVSSDLRPLPPAGTRLRADPGLRRLDAGRTLLGGSPLRIVKLSAAGAAIVERWLAGRPVEPGVAPRRLARRLLDGGLVHPVVEPADVANPDEASSPGRHRFARRDVTVVVPVRDDRQGLADALASLAAVAGDVGGIVVVDDGSDPPLAGGQLPPPAGAGAEAKAGRPPVRWLRHPAAHGPAAARTTGLAAVRSALVAFVDADVTSSVDDDATGRWLDTLLAHFDDDAVVAAAPRVRSRVGTGSRRDRYERRHSPLDLGSTPARVSPRTRVAYVPSAALLARTDALDAVGGFDAALRYGEDVDLVFRLAEAGGTVRYEPAACVEHRPRASWPAWWRQRVAYGSAAAPLARRHPGQVPPLAVSWWSLASWSLAAAGHPVLGVAVAAGSGALLPRKLRGVVAEPVVEGARLAAQGHAMAGRWIAQAVRRTWWPAAVAAALVSRRGRRALLAAAVLGPLLDWDPEIGVDRLRYVVLRVADDVAYGSGVWLGCWRQRTTAPLWPDLRSWPGRRAPTA